MEQLAFVGVAIGICLLFLPNALEWLSAGKSPEPQPDGPMDNFELLAAIMELQSQIKDEKCSEHLKEVAMHIISGHK